VIQALKPLPTLYRVNISDAIAYRGQSFIWILSTNTPLIMLLLWNAVAAEAPIGHWGQAEFRAYFLVTLMTRLLTGAWVAWSITMEVRDGTIAGRLLKPMHPFFHYAFENLGAWPVRLVMTSPILITAALCIGSEQVSHDWRQWAVFPLALFGGWLLSFMGLLCIGCLSLFWQSALSVADVWFGIYVVFSGYIIPIDLFPPWASTIVEKLPWAHILSTPVRAALGLDTLQQTLTHLAIQWGYIAVFALIAHILWRKGIERYEAFGG
jgi:ABC-2 type transport system permease protein